MLRVRSLLVSSASFACLLVAGCGGDDGDGSGGDAGVRADGAVATMDGGTAHDAGALDGRTGPVVVQDGSVVIVEDGGASWACSVITCAGHTTECGDCIDNDHDGVVDSHDPECLGPCDNTEHAALTTGVGGETGGPCRADCYFDYGNGSGGDDCTWDHRCDPRAVAPSYDPEGMSCAYQESRVGTRDCPEEQPRNCHDHCAPLTPNGCDCFGCCTFPELAGRSAAEGGEWVWLGSVFAGTNDGSCTFDAIHDRTLCRPCTPVADCLNTCGRCELCLGKTELPADCLMTPDAGPPPTEDAGPVDGGAPVIERRCDPGVQPCGLPTDPVCPPNQYCITGCCQQTII